MSRAAVVGLAALAAVNAVLVPLALHESAGTAVDLTAPGTGESATASMAPAPPLRSRPADGPATDPAGVDTAAVLDVTSGLAVYAPAATCGEPMAGLRLSKDDGRTWQTVPVPASSVLRILVADSQRIWLVGTDRECRATVYHTLDGGSTWQAERSTAGTWHRQVDPGSKQVHAPRGPIPSPCAAGGRVIEVVALRGATAAVRCQGGSVHQTNDGGRTWQVARPTRVRALAFADPRTLYVVEPGGEGCAGLRVSRRSAGEWERLGCVAEAASTAPTALSFVDAKAGLLVSDTTSYVTSDGGRTWQRRDEPAGRTFAAPAGQ